MTKYLAAIIGGVLAGVIGAAIWGGIAYATGYEIGWIAWGIGMMVGFGVLVCSRIASGEDQDGAMAMGVIAVVCTALSISAGKLMTVDLLLRKEIATYTDEAAMNAYFSNPEAAVSFVAGDLLQARIDAGQPFEIPADANLDDEVYSDDFSADIWAEAQAKWDAMDATAQEEYREQITEMIKADYDAQRMEVEFDVFKESFGLMDLIFFGLAVFTAFKIGAAPVEFTPTDEEVVE